MVAISALFVLAAFMLCVIAVIVAATPRPRVSVQGKPEVATAVRLDAAMHGTQTFEAAVAAGREARRVRLSRGLRLQKILTPVAFGLSGSVVLLALAARFLTGDREAGTVCTMMAVISLSFTGVAFLSAKKHAKRKMADSALDVDPS